MGRGRAGGGRVRRALRVSGVCVGRAASTEPSPPRRTHEWRKSRRFAPRKVAAGRARRVQHLGLGLGFGVRGLGSRLGARVRARVRAGLRSGLSPRPPG